MLRLFDMNDVYLNGTFCHKKITHFFLIILVVRSYIHAIKHNMERFEVLKDIFRLIS